MKILVFLIPFLICFAFHWTDVRGQAGWFNYNTSNGMSSNQALDITSDKFNNIWISLGHGSTNGIGLQKFDGSNWTLYNISNSGLISNTVSIVKADSQGNLWIIYYGGTGSSILGLTKFDGITWTTYDTLNSNILSSYISDIKIDNSDNIWLSCQGGISKFDGTTFTNYIIPHEGILLIEDSSSIWIAGTGLTHFNPLINIWNHYDQSNSNIPSYSISGIAKDTIGLIWLGLGMSQGGAGNGGTNGILATFDGTTFTSFWPFTNPYSNVDDIVIDDSNQVWVATRCEGIFKFDGLVWQNIPGILVWNCAYDIDVDYSNSIWIAEPNFGVWTNRNLTGIYEDQNFNSFKIYPNYGSENITVNGNFELYDRIKVYNTFGNSIFETELESEMLSYDLNITNYKSGIYFLKILRAEDEFVTSKFIVIR